MLRHGDLLFASRLCCRVSVCRLSCLPLDLRTCAHARSNHRRSAFAGGVLSLAWLGVDQHVDARCRGRLSVDRVDGASEHLRRCGALAAGFSHRMRVMAAACLPAALYGIGQRAWPGRPLVVARRGALMAVMRSTLRSATACAIASVGLLSVGRLAPRLGRLSAARPGLPRPGFCHGGRPFARCDASSSVQAPATAVRAPHRSRLAVLADARGGAFGGCWWRRGCPDSAAR